MAADLARRAAPWAAAALLTWTTGAAAFCRTTTCNPGDPKQSCEKDANGCLTSGKPLFWSDRCLTFSVSSAASPAQDLDYATVASAIEAGYATWIGVSCEGQAPALEVHPTPPVSCDEVEYNSRHGNANLWVFRDDEWPYGAGATLALTTITFNRDTGEIYDADVEVNSADNPLVIGRQPGKADLVSIATHETGHVLGLSHSPDRDATMYASYTFGTVGLRDLESDDIAGMCEIYPPGRSTSACNPTPRHGFSPVCAPADKQDSGCAVAAPRARGTSPAPIALLGLALALGASRRRRG